MNRRENEPHLHIHEPTKDVEIPRKMLLDLARNPTNGKLVHNAGLKVAEEANKLENTGPLPQFLHNRWTRRLALVGLGGALATGSFMLFSGGDPLGNMQAAGEAIKDTAVGAWNNGLYPAGENTINWFAADPLIRGGGVVSGGLVVGAVAMAGRKVLDRGWQETRYRKSANDTYINATERKMPHSSVIIHEEPHGQTGNMAA